MPLLLLFLIGGLWTAHDAARRGRNWFAWGVAVSVTGVALFAWLVVRRRFELGHHPRGGRFALALVAGLLFMVGLDLLLAANVASFLCQHARIEGHAMFPTLNDGIGSLSTSGPIGPVTRARERS